VRRIGGLLLAVLVGVVGCRGAQPLTFVDEPEPQPIARPFLPERMRRGVDGRTLPQVREHLAGVWKFRVTVVGAVQDLSVGYFADRGDRSSVAQTGVISVCLPKDSGPGQTWEVEAEFDIDRPIQRENGLLVWRFAKPVSTIRVG
jgi:hypothetical protein